MEGFIISPDIAETLWLVYKQEACLGSDFLSLQAVKLDLIHTPIINDLTTGTH